MSPELSMVLLIVIPLAAALASYPGGPRVRRAMALVTWVLQVIPLVSLWRAVAASGPARHQIGGWGSPLGIDLYADGLTVVMLAMTVAAGLGISLYASFYFSETPDRERRFWLWWATLLGALNGLYLSADIFNLYVTLELLGLSAVGLAALTGETAAVRAALRYLLIALSGSLAYLMGVALIYSGWGMLDWTSLGARVTPGPVASVALGLMTIGLLSKAAIFPFHFWLPPAHANAASPVSAILSALVVKGAFYIFLRVWVWVFPAVTHVEVADLISGLGALAVLWGSMVALRQARLKLLVAYSTVAQLGYLFLMIGLLEFEASASLAWKGGIYFALSHALAKAAMFLAAGIVLHALGHDRIEDMQGVASHLPMTAFAFGLGGVSLMGLPPSGGFIAKWLLLNAALAAHQWWLVAVLLGGGLLAAGYVFRVIRRVFLDQPGLVLAHRPPRILEWSALGLALAAILLGLVANEPIDLIVQALPARLGTAGVTP